MVNSRAELSQGEIAYRAVMNLIRSGALSSGDRIREVSLSEALSLSRTPIREALRKLEADGIIEHKARIGAVVRTLTHKEVVELYEMRLVLERTAAEMAAKHAVAAEIDEMEAINEIIARTTKPGEAAALNQKFHGCLYEATRNRFLMESTRALNNALLLLGPTTLADEARINTVSTQHQNIIEAIRSGDIEAAGASAEAHLETSLRHRLKVMRT